MIEKKFRLELWNFDPEVIWWRNDLEHPLHLPAEDLTAGLVLSLLSWSVEILLSTFQG
jgi:hypothetical protein